MKRKGLHPLFFRGIAHRGLHDEQIAENSLIAFQKAIEQGMAIEFDLHLTKDNQLVVFHDFSLLRMTGKEGEIERLTKEELERDYALIDGQKIPSFQEVLDLVQEQVPMVIELKARTNNVLQIASALKKALKQVKDPSKYCIISFDPRALLPIHSFHRSLLICKERLDILAFRFLFESLDVEACLLSDPRVQKYRNGHYLNCWTIRSEEELQKALPLSDMITFEHLPPNVVQNALSDR